STGVQQLKSRNPNLRLVKIEKSISKQHHLFGACKGVVPLLFQPFIERFFSVSRQRPSLVKTRYFFQRGSEPSCFLNGVDNGRHWTRKLRSGFGGILNHPVPKGYSVFIIVHLGNIAFHFCHVHIAWAL